jgi:hypothetical protein
MNVFRPMQMCAVLTRHKHYLHKPTAKISCFQKSAYYDRIKIFNNLPSYVRSLMNEEAQYEIALK